MRWDALLVLDLCLYTFNGVGRLHHDDDSFPTQISGGNCIKMGLPGKLILSKKKGLREVLFS